MPNKSYVRHDYLLAIALFCLGVLSRWPFMGKILYHWDSVNFAFSLQEFDVAKGQPHVPGYPLYVLLARGVNLIFQDAQLTLVTISLLSTGLAVAGLYLLGCLMFNRFIGLLGALFLLTSPLFWFYGDIALPHTLDTFAVISVAWLFYHVMAGRTEFVIPAAMWLALAGGMRPQTEVFLAPLTLYALGNYLFIARQSSAEKMWGFSKVHLKTLGIALLIFVAVNLVWFIPLLWLSGGYTRYFEIMARFSDEFQTTTSVFKGAGWVGLRRNIIKLTLYTFYGWGLPLIPVVLASVKMLFNLKSMPWQNLKTEKRFWFLLCWIAPSLGYYLLIHMGQQGLVFVYLPALMLISAISLSYLLGLNLETDFGFWLDSQNPKFLWPQIAIVVLVISNGLIFPAMPMYPLGTERVKLLTWDTLHQHDTFYQARFEAVPSQFSPANTLLLASEWRFPQYYLPQYKLLQYKLISRWEVGEGEASFNAAEMLDRQAMGLIPDKEGFFTVILFDDEVLWLNHSPDRQEYFALPNGQKLPYFRLNSNERLYVTPQYYEIRSKK